MNIRLNPNNGDLILDNIKITNYSYKDEVEQTVILNNGKFTLFSKNENIRKYVITFESKEYSCSVCFDRNLLVLFTFEYLAFAKDFDAYISRTDERIDATKKILKELNLGDKNSFIWGKVEYFYDPRNLTPLIIIKYGPKAI